MPFKAEKRVVQSSVHTNTQKNMFKTQPWILCLRCIFQVKKVGVSFMVSMLLDWSLDPEDGEGGYMPGPRERSKREKEPLLLILFWGFAHRRDLYPRKSILSTDQCYRSTHLLKCLGWKQNLNGVQWEVARVYGQDIGQWRQRCSCSVPGEEHWEPPETGQSPAGQSEEPTSENMTRIPGPVGGWAANKMPSLLFEEDGTGTKW